jgi:hypothetical protein
MKTIYSTTNQKNPTKKLHRNVCVGVSLRRWPHQEQLGGNPPLEPQKATASRSPVGQPSGGEKSSLAKEKRCG